MDCGSLDPAGVKVQIPVVFTASFSSFQTAGNVSPTSQVIQSGTSFVFQVSPTAASTAGDAEPEVAISGAGTVPVIVRTQVALTGTGGSFTGTLTGANGRGGRGESLIYSIPVPSGLIDMEVYINLPEGGDNLQGVLVGPGESTFDVQATLNKVGKYGAPIGYGKSLQFYRRTPDAGNWMFILELDNNIRGDRTSTPFTGTIVFNGENVSSLNMPTSGTTWSKGSSHTASVEVTNTGPAPISLFLDSRLENSLDLYRVAPGIQAERHLWPRSHHSATNDQTVPHRESRCTDQ